MRSSFTKIMRFMVIDQFDGTVTSVYIALDDVKFIGKFNEMNISHLNIIKALMSSPTPNDDGGLFGKKIENLPNISTLRY